MLSLQGRFKLTKGYYPFQVCQIQRFLSWRIRELVRDHHHHRYLRLRQLLAVLLVVRHRLSDLVVLLVGVAVVWVLSLDKLLDEEQECLLEEIFWQTRLKTLLFPQQSKHSPNFFLALFHFFRQKILSVVNSKRSELGLRSSK